MARGGHGVLGLLLLLLGVLVLVQVVDAACANFCSGHGRCGASNQCTCDPDWALAPDCSLRKCPTGVAWSDKAKAPNVAHANAECSNRGVCDYSKGECTCFNGFTGAACQRLRCPSDCSGHGLCYSSATLALQYGPDSSPGVGGDGVGPVYTNWEKDSMSSCLCDMGYTGPDCSQPFKEWTHLGVENNLLYHTGNPALSSFTCDISLITSANSPTCAITDVVATNVIEHTYCSNRGLCSFSSGQCICYADFKGMDCNQPSNVPDSIDDNDGFVINPMGLTYIGTVLHLKTAKGSQADFYFMKIESSTLQILTMNVDIRGDGLTTIQTGGLAVVTGGATISHDLDAASLTVSNANTGFSQAILKVISTRASQFPAADFKLIDASAGSVPAFSVEASGKTTIANGGLIVNGIGGGEIFNSATSAAALSVSATATSFVSDAVLIKTFSSSTHNLVKATVEATVGVPINLFTIANTGLTTITQGGLSVTAGGATIVAGGLHVGTAGQTIDSGGLHIQNGGETIDSWGLNVIDGGASIASISPTNDILTVKATATTYSSNAKVLHINSASTVPTMHYLVYAERASNPLFSILGTGRTEIYAGGLVVDNGGATIAAGGLTVTAGGATIAAGGLTVTNGGASISDNTATTNTLAVANTLSTGFT
ncbi:hypothetical protein BBJ29_009826, partial [Phytophthora kernoviae]